MTDRRSNALMGIGAMLLLGLAAPRASRAADESTTTQQMPNGMTKSHQHHVVATIQSVDKDARTVTVIGDDGKTRTLDVPKSVKSFDHLTAGQRVNLGYYQSLAIALAKPGEQPATGTQTSESSTNVPASEGQGPGHMNVRRVTTTAEITSVDAKNNQVTLRGSDGESHTVDVEDPSMRQRLSSLKAGETVQLTYTEAVAASLVPVKQK